MGAFKRAPYHLYRLDKITVGVSGPYHYAYKGSLVKIAPKRAFKCEDLPYLV